MYSSNLRGYNTLHTAAENKDSHILEILISHKNSKVHNVNWKHNYINIRTEAYNRMTALEIAIQNEDKECVEVLLKYLVPSFREQKAKEVIGLQTAKATAKTKSMSIFHDAIAFMKQQGLYTKEHSELLARSFSNRSNSFKKCYCNISNAYSNITGYAESLIKKCYTCVSQLPRNRVCGCGRTNDAIQPCSQQYTYNVVRYLINKNINVSDYVLNEVLHGALAKHSSNCAIHLLIRSFGMKNLDRDHFKFLVMMYWDMNDFKAIGLLYASVSAFPLFKCIITDRVVTKSSDTWPFLLDCITQTTCVYQNIASWSIFQYLVYAGKQPRTLRNCCVISIRRCISSNVIQKAEQLPIPLELKNAIKLTEYEHRCSTQGVCHGIL